MLITLLDIYMETSPGHKIKDKGLISVQFGANNLSSTEMRRMKYLHSISLLIIVQGKVLKGRMVLSESII